MKLPGVGHSSPVLWKDRIFLTSSEESKRHILCLSAATGKPLWTRTYPFEPYSQHDFNSFASSTPAVDANRVYVAWTGGGSLEVLALDHHGKDAWSRKLGSFHGEHGSGTSPIVLGDRLILANDHDGDEPFLIGLDVRTGQTSWKRPRSTGSPTNYSTPVVYRTPGRKPQVVFTSTQHGMTSLDPAAGALNWELKGILPERCVGSPVVADGLIFAASGTGGVAKEGVAVRPGTREKPSEVVYRLRRGIPYVPTPIAVKGLLFLWSDGGIVTCVRAATGDVLWSERVEGRYFGSPVSAGGKLYAMSADGKLAIIEASEKFRLVAQIPLGEETSATPALSGGVLYLRTASHLISVGGKKRKG